MLSSQGCFITHLLNHMTYNMAVKNAFRVVQSINCIELFLCVCVCVLSVYISAI